MVTNHISVQTASTRSSARLGVLTLTATLLAGGLATASTATPAEAATAPASKQNVSFSAAGTSSTYSVYANGVDPSKAVGAMYYFGGDYWSRSESEIANPNGSVVQGLAATARSKNMILVIPASPDKDARGDGITWWENMDTNGAWFRALQKNLTSTYGLDTSRTWLTGYSGGAEFISYEVLPDSSNWIRGGGATIIGGGGAEGGLRFSTAPTQAVKNLDLNWHAGTKDVSGNTNPPEWSGLGAARGGRAAYQRAGFTNTSLDVIQGADHYQYNYAALTATDMGRMPSTAPSTTPTTTPTKPTPPTTPKFTVKNGIKAKYDALGGSAVLGAPTSNEIAVPGGVYQTFSKGGYRIYWSQPSGAHSASTQTRVGAAYANTGHHTNWGIPKSDLGKLAGGYSYQDFRKADGTIYRAMNGPKGVYTVTMTSPIGKAWSAAGHEHNWGFPIGTPYSLPGGTAQDFSNGWYAYWNHSTGVVKAYRW